MARGRHRHDGERLVLRAVQRQQLRLQQAAPVARAVGVRGVRRHAQREGGVVMRTITTGIVGPTEWTALAALISEAMRQMELEE